MILGTPDMTLLKIRDKLIIALNDTIFEKILSNWIS